MKRADIIRKLETELARERQEQTVCGVAGGTPGGLGAGGGG